MTTDFRALCAELLYELCCFYKPWDLKEERYSDAMKRARAALAEPEPKRRYIYNPVQIAECGGPCEQGPEHCDCGELWVTEPEPEGPTPQPVPVSERLPGSGDCDAEGRCWLCGKVEGDWRLLNPEKSGVPQLKYCFSHWLPAHALPLPQ